jgi:hypothetical protein
MLLFSMQKHLTTRGKLKFLIVTICTKKSNIWTFRRDFRLVIADPNNPGKKIPHPVVWISDTKIIKTVISKTTITYSVAFQVPLSGWQGFFFQLSFPGLDGTVLEVSSEVNIFPETFPFPDCFRDSCQGSLV